MIEFVGFEVRAVLWKRELQRSNVHNEFVLEPGHRPLVAMASALKYSLRSIANALAIC